MCYADILRLLKQLLQVTILVGHGSAQLFHQYTTMWVALMTGLLTSEERITMAPHHKITC